MWPEAVTVTNDAKNATQWVQQTGSVGDRDEWKKIYAQAAGSDGPSTSLAFSRPEAACVRATAAEAPSGME